MITRRDFLKTTTLATASALLAPGILRAGPHKKDIGLQLYTVRDHISKDLPGTLRAVAKIGYTRLEAAGYNDGKFYGMAPGEFRSLVSGSGMQPVSSHVAFSPEQSRHVIDAHLELDVPYVVYPWISMPEIPSADDYLRAAGLFNRLGEACKKDGLRFGYHNHDFEFKKIGDTTGFDILLKNTDPDLVCFEADIYWMQYANIVPGDYLSKYPGRFELWHIKDMDSGTGRTFTEVGEGTIPYGDYFTNFKDISGMKYFFVEQDKCNRDSLESTKISYRNLKKIL
ncbi:MAG TPA: TIM barrel protein [Bacteroidales bacterium]|nr:TIM barrel protein [Bacteroidales bacterium]